MTTRTVDPREELPIVLSKLRLSRELMTKHDENIRLPDGTKKIHIDCDICTHQKRLNYLLDVLAARMKYEEKKWPSSR